MDANTLKLAELVRENAEAIAKALKKGDVEVRRSRTGISVAEVNKKVIVR